MVAHASKLVRISENNSQIERNPPSLEAITMPANHPEPPHA